MRPRGTDGKQPGRDLSDQNRVRNEKPRRMIHRGLRCPQRPEPRRLVIGTADSGS